MIDAELGVAAVAPVADDGRVARGAELAGFVAGVFLEVVVRVEDPLTVAEHADRIAARVVPIADDRDIALLGRNGP